MRPNIICFVTDQLRADHLGCYGNPDVLTPNIDGLAREGIRFTQSYVANPVCSPNRACMFTGRYPKAHRLRENGNTLPPDEAVLPELLRRAGYRTASFGKLHLAPFGLTLDTPAQDHERAESTHSWAAGRETMRLPYYGLEHVYYVGGHGHYTFGHYRRELDEAHPGAWEQMLPPRPLKHPTLRGECWKSTIPEELHYNTVIADRTIEYLRAHNGQDPFFIWCSFPDPHHPWSPPAPWCDRYDPDEVTFTPDRREGELDDLPSYMRKRAWFGEDEDRAFREVHALEYGMISMVDHNIGRVLAALEEGGLMENTVIAFFSDHGDLMGDHRLDRKGPFLFRGLMQVPTIVRLPAPAEGRVSDALFSTVDLCPTLLDLAGVEQPAGSQGHSQVPVLTGERERLREQVYAEYDESRAGYRLRHLRSEDWALTYYLRHDCGMLFDLRSDPGELYNLWDDPASAEAKRDLLRRLLDETAAADDWLPPKRCWA